jgi:carbon-monoxide dehydrogenase medium subunit
LAEPTSLRDAIALLDPDDSTVRPIAGGTALMLMMKAGVFRPTRLGEPAQAGARYSRIAAGADGVLAIGAMTPLAEVERSAEVARAAPVIPARCGGSPTCACAMWRPSAAIWRMAIRIWTCRPC